MLPNAPAQDIAEFIVQNGIATFDANNASSLPLMRIGVEPETQDRTLITIADAGGPPSNPAWQFDEPRIVVRTKSDKPYNYPSAWNAQQQIKNLLLGMKPITINGTRYSACWQQVDIAPLAQDYNNRIILVSTYRFIRNYDAPNRGCIEENTN